MQVMTNIHKNMLCKTKDMYHRTTLSTQLVHEILRYCK